jgi:hypothetical protein
VITISLVDTAAALTASKERYPFKNHPDFAGGFFDSTLVRVTR